MAFTKKPDRYWVMGAGEPHHERGFKSIVNARKLAIRELKANKSFSVRTYGYLDIVAAKEEPYAHMMNYRLIGLIGKSDVPNFYLYKEYKSGDTKLVAETGAIVRGRRL